MENSAPQTQYLGHVFIDVIFRFSPGSLCPCRPLSGHASCSCPHTNTRQHRSLVLTRQSADADSSPSSPLLYDFPYGTNLVSFREAWHPRVNVGGGWDTCNPPSSMWAGVSVPSPTVCHIPTTFNLPFLSLFVCLTPRLACSFVTSQCCCLSRPLTLSQFLTNLKVVRG